MAFNDSAEKLLVKAHLSHVPRPALIGAAVLLALTLSFALRSAYGAAVPSFTFEDASAQEAGSGDASDSEGRDEDREDGASSDAANAAPAPSAADAAETSSDARVHVHVAGAVVDPGMYELPASARVNDAIAAASGFSDDAIQDSVNLASALTDGQQVRVLAQGEAQANPSAASASGADAAPSASSQSGPVNINTADEAALDRIPGVGPATARAIVEEREKNGPFSSVDDVTRVEGIGKKKLERMRDSLCV
ncbi:ComEA family DNA-binding protein [Slackia exigua]|uniref:ComEA family DNA-binding protein n=1 Tax=Slackia exigua TaxID=84109 RepID=UPI002002A400|nr:ComEA family DNA-binding protein [Slackia exigua]MCK6139486.1 ComEA family DNA-binding protein [Slackia exigua]